MDTAIHEQPVQEVERLILDLARAWHWTGLYQPGHPFLSERMKSLHLSVAARAAREPSSRLLLGIARDRVLYKDVFLGKGHPLIANFAEGLYLHQVATLGLDGEATTEGLLAFFRCLHDSRSGKTDVPPMEFLKREGIRGIHLYPYNYKEVLSRRIVDQDESKAGPDRGDAMWRMLLTANVADEEGERKVLEELSGSPELITAILRRAKVYAGKGGGTPGASAEFPEEAVTPEVLRRIFHRIGETLRFLPEEGKRKLLISLDEGLLSKGGGPGEEPDDASLSLEISLARSLAGECSDNEFLDLLATLLSVEEKGGKRLRRIFEIIAADRDIHGSLLPKINERSRESLRAKNYYAVKTWETIERLLLSRSEAAYLEKDHSGFMEALSGDMEPRPGMHEQRKTVDPAVLGPFEEPGIRRRSALVLMELLGRESIQSDFLELLEEVRKMVPNLISRKEFALLEKILGALSWIERKASRENGAEVRKVIRDVDYGQVIDLYLSRDGSCEEDERSGVLLADFGEEAVHPLLDRLLMEPEANRRRALIALAVRMGVRALPAIQDKLTDSRWYFVRNLCVILGEIGFRGGAPGLIRLLKHPEARVRKEAVLALGKLKAPEASHALGRILLSEGFLFSSKEESLRMDAASALFRIGCAEALGYLHRGKTCRRSPVREHCAALLRTLVDR